jgi:hypothetical protein
MPPSQTERPSPGFTTIVCTSIFGSFRLPTAFLRFALIPTPAEFRLGLCFDLSRLHRATCRLAT